MRRFFFALFSAALLFSACGKYDDSAIQNRINNLEVRVTELESVVNGINSNIASLQTLVRAMQDQITVKVVSRTNEGYSITFSDGVTVTLTNGADGRDGKDGAAGGKGDKGDKGDSPVVGVKADGGVYYWTVDGEWLLDAEGNRVTVTGGVPEVKVEDGKWYVSYDGTNWQEAGSAEASSGIVVTEDANFVYITVPGSGTFTLSKATRFTIDIAGLDYFIQEGATTEIPYSIFGADGSEKLFVQSTDFTVSYDAEKIYVTPKEGVVAGDVLVMAVRNSDQAVCGVVLSFSQGVFEVTQALQVPAAGGEAEAFVKTNLEYEVVIPEDAASWLALAPETKAVREDVLRFTVQPNESDAARSAKVEVKPSMGASVFITVFQSGKSLYPCLTIAEFLEKPVGTEWYQLTGRITEIVNATYGNFYMEDETGSVYVYGLTATMQEKNDKSFSSLGLKVGDILTAVGYRTEFTDKQGVTIIEFGGNVPAFYISHVPGEGGGEPDPGQVTGSFVSSIAWTLGSSAYDQAAVVNGKEVGSVLKLGTSSKAGDAVLTIPEGVTKIGFYAVSWKGTSSADISVGGKNVTVSSNEGASGNAPYTLSVTDKDYYEVEVTGASVSLYSDVRVIVFGVNPKE